MIKILITRAPDKEYLTIILGYFFLFLYENIHCDPSLELSQLEGSNEGSQCILLWKISRSYLTIIFKYSPYLELRITMLNTSE